MDIQRDVEHVPKLIDCSDRVMSEAPADFAELTATVATLKEGVAYLTTTMAGVITQIAKLVDTIADARRAVNPELAEIARTLTNIDSRLAVVSQKVETIRAIQQDTNTTTHRAREVVTWKA